MFLCWYTDCVRLDAAANLEVTDLNGSLDFDPCTFLINLIIHSINLYFNHFIVEFKLTKIAKFSKNKTLMLFSSVKFWKRKFLFFLLGY